MDIVNDNTTAPFLGDQTKVKKPNSTPCYMQCNSSVTLLNLLTLLVSIAILIQVTLNNHSDDNNAIHFKSASNSLKRTSYISNGGMLDGDIFLVTGAGSGIGLATARAVVMQCGAVILLGRNKTKIEISYSNLTSVIIPKIEGCTVGFPFASFEIADIRNISEMRAALRNIGTKYGKLSGAANIAGISGPVAALDSSQMDEWIGSYHDPILNNLYGTINSIRAEIEFWKNIKQRSGVIVNAASVNSFVGGAGGALYVASKFGIAGVTKSVAMSYAYGNAKNSYLTLRVNAIAPGMVDTPFTRNQARGLQGLQPFQCYDKNNQIVDYGCPDISESDPLYQKFAAQFIESGGQPIMRMIDPSEMANIVVFLLSNYTTAVTGDVWLADGGTLAQ